MVSLLFRFSGDSSPLIRALDAMSGPAKRAGDVVGKEFGTQMKQTVLRYIGAGAIINVIRKTMTDAMQVQGEAIREGLGVEPMQELAKAAAAAGMTVKELREAAPGVADSFVKLMEAVKGSGGDR